MSINQDLPVGRVLGSYRVERYLDEGGMADLYLGVHIRLGTYAALKILKEKLAKHDKHRKEFQEEAVRIAHLDHPNIVRILDCGLVDDKPYLIMPLAKGSLKNTQGKIISLEMIFTYIKQIGDALQYAHEHDIVHRDIKPGNFLIGSRNELLLSDFGIATITYSVRVEAQEFAGTPHYMPPEQWRNQAVRASDQYALGICVYQWLCGDVPFRGSMEQLMWAHMQQDPLSLKEKKISIVSEVEEVVMKALAKDPQQRFTDVQAFVLALENAIQPHRKPVGTLLRVYGGTTAAWATNDASIACANQTESHIWNLNDPDDHKIFPIGASRLTWIQNGKRLALAQQKKMLLLDSETGTLLSDISIPFSSSYGKDEQDRDHTWSPNGEYISYVEGRTVPYLSMLDVRNSVKEHVGPCLGPHCWSADGHYLAYVNYQNGQAVIFDTRTKSKRVLKVFDGPAIVVYLALSPDARLLAIKNFERQTWQIWDISTALQVSLPATLNNILNTTDFGLHNILRTEDFELLFAFSPNNARIAWSAFKDVQVWDAVAGQLLFTYRGHSGAVQSIEWSSDGTRIASTSTDGTVHIWQV